MIKTMRYCLLEGKFKCELKTKNRVYDDANCCCNFCSVENCEQRCKNSWEKCGVFAVELKGRI